MRGRLQRRALREAAGGDGKLSVLHASLHSLPRRDRTGSRRRRLEIAAGRGAKCFRCAPTPVRNPQAEFPWMDLLSESFRFPGPRMGCRNGFFEISYIKGYCRTAIKQEGIRQFRHFFSRSWPAVRHGFCMMNERYTGIQFDKSPEGHYSGCLSEFRRFNENRRKPCGFLRRR